MPVDIARETAERHGLRLPEPPPLLHTRHEPYDRPSTPSGNGFTSPAQTPQGSPSKNKMPPGSLDLPNVFEKAMKLAPSSPTKSSPAKATYNHYNHPMFSPPKAKGSMEDFSESVIHQPSSSPTRRSQDKENAAPSRLPQKSLGRNPAAAALSRHESYQPPRDDPIGRRQVQMRGLTPEELEKLQNPRVKRLVNVTQLCMFCYALLPESMWTDR